MKNVRFVCSLCKEKHNSKMEKRLCELYHQEDLTSEEIFEYVQIKDQLMLVQAITQVMESKK